MKTEKKIIEFFRIKGLEKTRTGKRLIVELDSATSTTGSKLMQSIPINMIKMIETDKIRLVENVRKKPSWMKVIDERHKAWKEKNSKGDYEDD